MTRGFPSRPVFSAALVLALIASAMLTAFTAPVNAGPDQETASSSVTITQSIVDDGPSARFGFSVLDQNATAIFKSCSSGCTGNTVTEGTPVTLQVTVATFQNTFPGGVNLMGDTVWPRFTVVSAGPATGGGAAGPCSFTQGTNTIQGSSGPAGSTGVICQSAAGGSGANTSAVWNIVVVPNPGGPLGMQHADQVCNLNGVTCTTSETIFDLNVQSNPAISSPTPTLTATATAVPPTATNTAVPPTATNTAVAATATPTSTAVPPTATRTNTPVIPPPTPPVSGTPGVPCTTVIGGVCSVTGGVTGTWTKTGSGTFTFSAASPANAVIGGVPIIFIPTTANASPGEQFSCPAVVIAGATTTCTGTTAGDPLQGATITIAFPIVGGGFATVTGTITGTGGAVSLTLQQAITQAQGTAGFLTGTAGVPCATLGSVLGGAALGGLGSGLPGVGIGGITNLPGVGIGGIGSGLPLAGAQAGATCQITGGVNGTWTRTGSGTYTVTATVPAGVGAGVVPVIVFSTDAGFFSAPCTAVALGTTTVTCTGATPGNPLQGSTVAVCFTAATTCAIGTILGPGPVILNNNLPLLPPPPLQFIPPPPPPLLPPPPPAPVGGAMMAPSPMASVPIIPEADSIFLVVGGLVALGALAGLRSLRRRRDDEA